MLSGELNSPSPEDREFLVAQAFDRYFETSGMFGTVDDCMAMLKQLKDAGFDHLARLHDAWRAHEGA
ncbi:hypothetical protein P3T36_006838 [Kitasatospora sp. MAP12-15]|uniref:hypothetical protein n=1 Tax=unclassified Kitasatospora TaxID=2633591 RepID=UPI0024753B0E|nr:hypothetical protein [Kitasatospora sp. MAP12-44]MDH6112135.1 hypothetical protein [Kitasatospora sp. MAP12-44]